MEIASSTFGTLLRLQFLTEFRRNVQHFRDDRLEILSVALHAGPDRLQDSARRKRKFAKLGGANLGIAIGDPEVAIDYRRREQGGEADCLVAFK
jgi:hypothetical protein